MGRRAESRQLSSGPSAFSPAPCCSLRLPGLVGSEGGALGWARDTEGRPRENPPERAPEGKSKHLHSRFTEHRSIHFCGPSSQLPWGGINCPDVTGSTLKVRGGRQHAQGHRHPEWRSQSPPSPSDPPPAPFPLQSCVSVRRWQVHLPKALPPSIHFLLPQQKGRKKSPATSPILRSSTNFSA